MKIQTYPRPQPHLIWKYLVWTFGWTWGFWGIAILLKNIWPENSLDELPFYIGSFGPMVASFIVLEIKGFKNCLSFIFSGKRGAWLYLLIYGGAFTAIIGLAAGGRLVDGALVSLPMGIIIATLIGGGNEEPGWRGFLQPALEKKFSYPIATLTVGIIWGIWHVPLWFYNREQTSFLLFFALCLIVAIWFAGLYRRTQSVIVCMFFHALINTINISFVGMDSFIRFADLSKMNPLLLLGGFAAMSLYSIYLWYRTYQKESTYD